MIWPSVPVPSIYSSARPEPDRSPRRVQKHKRTQDPRREPDGTDGPEEGCARARLSQTPSCAKTRPF